MDTPWHELTFEATIGRLSSSRAGLSSAEVAHRLKDHGSNVSAKEKTTSALHLFFSQFKNFIVYVLLVAAGLSFVVGDMVEFYIILGIVLFIVLLSFFEEYNAAREMESLRKLTPHMARVIRNGDEREIDARELVPGDILLLKSGDIVPADARVIESVNMQVDESALTGESVPIMKHNRALVSSTPLAERANIVHAGGKVVSGHGSAVIVATGKRTQLGIIASLVQDAKEELSPLQKKLNTMGKQFSYIVIVACILIVIIGIARGEPLNTILLLAVAVAVGGIPESLPAVIGVALAIGMKRMAKQNAIIKRLAAVETLGTCTVICSDKTGTLTQNKMVIENIWGFDSQVAVTGNGLHPEGIFLREQLRIDPTKRKEILKLLEIGVLCNNASLKHEDNAWHIDGESTEGALLVLAKKAGVEKEMLHKKFPRVHEHPFDSERKCMSSVHMVKNVHVAYAKGAPERILDRCSYYMQGGKEHPLTKTKRKEILEQNEAYATKGYRVLALAYKEHKQKSLAIHHVEKDLVFAGLVSLRDPPEPTALNAITQCEEAGIRVVMITGDSPLTARAVAEELGILRANQRVMTGDELDKLSDEEFLRVVQDVAVYARVTPKHKLRVVKALQDKGEIVAMTGDGVNDAPALKKADIGVAMGKCGTEVAKDASEMVIKDDNFATIVYAVKEGRTIYSNIQKFIYYLLPGNFSGVMLILIATLAGFFPPLTPLMILFINLVTSDIPALGLSLERPDKHIMRQKPRPPKEPILSPYILLKISQVVPIMFLGTLLLYMWEFNYAGADLATARTVAFVTVILFTLFHSLNAKSFNKSVFRKETLSNPLMYVGLCISLTVTFFVVYVPLLQTVFGTVSLNIMHWIPILITTGSVIAFVEVQKTIIDAEIREREQSNVHPTRA